MKWSRSRLIVLVPCFIAIASIAVSLAEDRGRTKEKAKIFPDWQELDKPGVLQPGTYVSALSMGFSQEIALRSDGSFESRFSGEVHQKGRPAEWREWEFSGKWIVENGWVTFSYRGENGDLSYSFLIGLWRSRLAFIFARPAADECKFIAECFVSEPHEPTKAR